MSDVENSIACWPPHLSVTIDALENARADLLADQRLTDAEFGALKVVNVAALHALWRAGNLPLPEIRAVWIKRKRLCAVIDDPAQKIVVKHLANRVAALPGRHFPPLPYVSVDTSRGVEASAFGLMSDARKQWNGAVEVFDAKDAFPSLDLIKVLDQIDAATGAPSYDTIALRALYREAHAAGVPGISQGLAPSNSLADLALRPLDLALSAHGSVRRYMDNYALIGRLSDQTRVRVEEAAASMGLRLHKWETAKINQGLISPPINWLGLKINGRQVDLAAETLAKIRANYEERLSENGQKAADSYLDHVIIFYRRLISGGRKGLLSIFASMGLGSPSMRSPSSSSPSRSAHTSATDAPRERPPTAVNAARDGTAGTATPKPGGVANSVAPPGSQVEKEKEYVARTYAWSREDNDGIIESAIERATDMMTKFVSAQGEKRLRANGSFALLMICADFLATNDFGAAGTELPAYFARLEENLGIKIFATTKDGMEIVYVHETLAKKLIAANAAGSDADAPDETKDEEP